MWQNILKFLLLELKELGINGQAEITIILGKDNSIAEIKTTISITAEGAAK